MKIKFLDLGKQPLANNFTTIPNDPNQYYYNLQMGFDEETKLVSQMEFVDPPKMFNENYVYNSSHSLYLVNHFRDIAEKLKQEYKPKKVLEIGTNSLPFLKHFHPNHGYGIEPCKNFADYGISLGYRIYEMFWDLDAAVVLKEDSGKFDLVYSANCMCHIPNIVEAFQAVDYVLNDNGIFVFEDPSLLSILQKNAWDQIYDEHFGLFSLISLSNIIWKNTNLDIFKIEKLDIHGGSNRIYIKKKNNNNIKSSPDIVKFIEEEVLYGIDKIETYFSFSKRIEKSKETLIDWLKFLVNNNYNIIGYSAPSKTTTILNYCKINKNQIPYFIDTIPEKFNKYYPGTNIKIYEYTKDWWKKDNIKYSFIGAWNFSDIILEKENDFKKNGGRFLSHIPYTRLL